MATPGPGKNTSSRPAKNGRNGRAQRENGSRGRRDAIAALDLGTNNCRLLIAYPTRNNFRVVDGFSRIVRLGEGLVESGRICEAAMSRTISALNICASKMKKARVAKARCVATEAARQAANCERFVEKVKGHTGIELEIISSREEAELTLAGCLPLLDPEIPYALMFDVGGGSAEIVWMRLDGPNQADILGWISLPCGVVTLTERHGSEDFSPEAYQAVIDEIADLLAPFDEKYGIRAAIERGEAQMLGTAGTVTTIAGVNMGLERYNRAVVDGSYLTFDDVFAVSGDLASSTFAERAAHPSIGRGRADLVVAGCAVLEAVCRTWPAGQLRVADRGVREGLLLSLASEMRQARRTGKRRSGSKRRRPKNKPSTPQIPQPQPPAG